MALAMKIYREISVEVTGLGERIRQARKLDHRTMTELAKLAGMTPANWYKLEKEEYRKVPLKTLRRIEQTLGVDFGINL